MFTIRFDTSDIDEFLAEKPTLRVDVQKAVTWYVNQVYADLAKQHGRRYTYTTPPAVERTVLRMRSRGLLDQLRDSRFVQKVDAHEWKAGFNISRGSYLSTHEGSFDPSPTVINSNHYMTIPLRAALNSNGTPIKLSARQWSGLKFYRIRKGVHVIGENEMKLQGALVLGKSYGHGIIPYYLLAKSVTIPKRIFIKKKMEEYYDNLYDRLDLEVKRAIDRVSKK